MEAPPNDSYLEDLGKYYDCLEVIYTNCSLIKSAENDLSWYKNKLQEGRKLAISFGSTDQGTGNLPRVNLNSQTRVDKEKIINIIELIKEYGDKKLKEQNFINDSNQKIQSFFLSKDTLLDELEKVKKQKFFLIIAVTFYSIILLFLGLIGIAFVVPTVIIIFIFYVIGASTKE